MTPEDVSREALADWLNERPALERPDPVEYLDPPDDERPPAEPE